MVCHKIKFDIEKMKNVPIWFEKREKYFHPIKNYYGMV